MKESEIQIKSIEIQLVRVETFEEKTNATEIQNIQVADGNVLPNLEIPLYMLFPVQYSCATYIHNEFKILQEIGSGNLARVNLCQLKKDVSQKFALKTIYKATIKSSKRNISQMLCEIDVLRRLDHPHVVPIFEVFESSKYIHIVQ